MIMNTRLKEAVLYFIYIEFIGLFIAITLSNSLDREIRFILIIITGLMMTVFTYFAALSLKKGEK